MGIERENLHRSNVQSKRFRIHRWDAVGLGNDSADGILVRSGIRHTCNRGNNSKLSLLTSIVAINPGSPDNFTSNVGGRGYSTSKVIQMSRIEEISNVTYIGLLSMGERGR